MTEPIEQIREIRSIMERSSKFLSLSGLSGIVAGICALLGAWHVGREVDYEALAQGNPDVLPVLIQDAFLVLAGALFAGLFFTIRKAKKKGIPVWGPASRQLLRSLLVPLVAGGIYATGLIYQGEYLECFSVTLIFYGLALVSGSKYTVNDTYYLGLAQIALGLAAFLLSGYYLLFWAIGFGVLHLVYGVAMYVRYDR
jgi:hypothetical protein